MYIRHKAIALHEEVHSNQQLRSTRVFFGSSFPSLSLLYLLFIVPGESIRPAHFRYNYTFLHFQKIPTFIMKNSIIAIALIGAAVAYPAGIMKKREVPQEHAHENIVRAVNTLLKLDNPDNIQDAVFGLLGAAAAIKGAGNIADAGKICGSCVEMYHS
jgi:hypothetical protein